MAKANATQTVNPFDLATYEEWKVDPVTKYRLNDEAIRESYHEFNKEKHIKDTVISHKQAETLNEQSANSKIRYYLKAD